MIVFSRFINLMQERDISIYHLVRDRVIGRATLDKIRKNEGHIDTRSINAICKYLDCQPSDIMEYIPDAEEDKTIT